MYAYLMPTPMEGKICRRMEREVIETEDDDEEGLDTEDPDTEEFDGNEAHLIVVWDTDLDTEEPWGNSGALTMRQTCRQIRGEVTCIFSVLHLSISTLVLWDLRDAWYRGAMTERVKIRQRVTGTGDGSSTGFVRLPWDHAAVVRIVMFEPDECDGDRPYAEEVADIMGFIVTCINWECADRGATLPLLQLAVDEFLNTTSLLDMLRRFTVDFWPECIEDIQYQRTGRWKGTISRM